MLTQLAFVVLWSELPDWRLLIQHVFHVQLRNCLARVDRVLWMLAIGALLVLIRLIVERACPVKLCKNTKSGDLDDFLVSGPCVCLSFFSRETGPEPPKQVQTTRCYLQNSWATTWPLESLIEFERPSWLSLSPLQSLRSATLIQQDPAHHV